MSIVLSERMKAILSSVPHGVSMADIGTDHAHIPIHAIETGKMKWAIATDLRRDPLEIARKNVEAHQLERFLELRLGDGLQPIQVGEVDVIVSAGIGGHVHAEMLKMSPNVAQSAKILVFQPMNASHILRQQLDHHRFAIVDESLVIEDDRIYEIIVASHTHPNDAYARYRGDDLWMKLAYTYGPHLIHTSSDLLLLRVHRELDKRRRVLQSVQQSSAQGAAIRARQLQQEIDEISLLTQALGGTSH